MTKQSAFSLAIVRVFSKEGGEVNHKDDPGGHTNLGITQATLDRANKKRFSGVKSVKNLTRATAAQIYYDNYWLPMNCDKIAKITDHTSSGCEVSGFLFDCAVNHGNRNAGKLFQRTINLFRRGGRYKKLKVDGIVGKNTIRAAAAHLRDKKSVDKFMQYFTYMRGSFFIAICEKRDSSKTFLHGWLNRVDYWR